MIYLEEEKKKKRLGFVWSSLYSKNVPNMQRALLPVATSTCWGAEELASMCPDQMKSWELWDSFEQLRGTSAVTKVTLPFKFGLWKRSGKTKWSVMDYKTLPTVNFVFWQNKSGFACVNVWVTSLNICLFTFMDWSVPVLKKWVVGLQNKFNLFEKSVVEESPLGLSLQSLLWSSLCKGSCWK